MFLGIGVGILVFQIVFLTTYRLFGFLTILIESEMYKNQSKDGAQTKNHSKRKMKKIFKQFWKRKRKHNDKGSGVKQEKDESSPELI